MTNLPTDLINKHEQLINSFESEIGLPYNTMPGDQDTLKKYLTMDIVQLDKMDIKDCANASYKLTQFSLYIQRCLNKEKAKVRIFTNRINSIIGPKINQYSGAWNMQRASAIADNDAAQELEKLLLESEVKQDDLEYISKGISELAVQMKNLQFAKRNNNE